MTQVKKGKDFGSSTEQDSSALLHRAALKHQRQMKVISGLPFWLGDYEQQCVHVTKKRQMLLQTYVPSLTVILIYLLDLISVSIISSPTHRGL